MAESKKVTEQKIEAAVLLINEARAAALNSIEQEIEALYQAYFDRVRSVISSNKDLRRTEALTLQNATAVMAQLETILSASGLGALVVKFGKEFPTLAKSAAAYYEALGVNADDVLAGISKQTLSAWVDFSANELTNLVSSSLLAPVRSALLQVNFGNLTRDNLIDQITAIEPSLSQNDANVLVNESFSQFQRAVVVAGGEEAGLKIYHYTGPDDSITSAQCQAMLRVTKHGAPGLLYKEEIGPWLHPLLEKYNRNPLLAGGHPNCRHHWTPIPEDYAIELGFKP